MKQFEMIFKSSKGTFLLLFLLCCVKASAGTDYYCDFSENGIYYLYVNGTTNEVAVSYNNYETGRYGGNYTNYTGIITVPSTVTHEGKTYTVTAVSSHAFQECPVTQVNLPNTIKTIGNSAFLDCYQLTYINLPQSITIIGDDAFNGCTALSSVTLPNGLKTIGSSTFASCKSFTSITIPNGVTSIGSSAFSGCSKLSSISIPSSIEIVGSSAFYGTAWYTNQPDGVVYVGNIAYQYKGTMPANTHINLKAGTRGISANAFAFTNLTSIEIPSSLKRIESSAFKYCSSLTSITLPDNVTSIGDYAFQYCTSMSSFTFPSQMTFINSYVLAGCSALSSVTIPSSVTSIGSSAFEGCSALTSVVIPNSVGRIGNKVFYNCTSLTSITIPSSVINIGSSAFEGTLWYTNQPDGVVYAGNVAYKYKGSMPADTKIVLNEGTLAITSSAFSSCTGLTSIFIPSSMKVIGSYAFQNCTGLQKVIVPDIAAWCNISFGDYTSNPLDYAKHLFADENTEITDLIIPNGVTTISNNAFYNCWGITSLKLPKSLTEIGGYAFYGCMLEMLTVEAVEPLPIPSTTFIHPTGSSYTNCVSLYVPLGSKSAYENADVWNSFKEIIEYIAPTDISSSSDAIYASSTTALKGSTASLAICMKNAQSTNGYSFDLKLPDGVTLAKDNNDEYVYTLSNRHNGHSATVNYREATGVYSFAVLSLSSKDIKENDGTILTLQLNISNELTEGDYAVQVKNAKYSLSSGASSVVMEDVTSLLTIESYAKGDANGDGMVDIADAVCIVNHIVGKATPAYVAIAADANGDGVVDIADAVRIVNLIVGKIDALSRQQDMEWGLPEPE